MQTYSASKLIYSTKKIISLTIIVFLILTIALYTILPDLANAIGNIVTISGFPIAFVGLVITYESLKKTELAANSAKDSAVQTQEAIAEVKERLNSSFAIVGLVTVEEIMVNIKELHRDGKWESVLGKYERLNSALAELRSLPISQEEKQKVVGCSGHISVMEQAVESYLQNISTEKNSTKPDTIRFNGIMSHLIEEIREVLGSHKQGVIRDN